LDTAGPDVSEPPRQVLRALGFAGLDVLREPRGPEPPGKRFAERRRRHLGYLGLVRHDRALLALLVPRMPEVDVQVLDLLDQEQDRLRRGAELAPLVAQETLRPALQRFDLLLVEALVHGLNRA